MRGWSMDDWRDLNQKDRTDLIAYEMRRQENRAKIVDEMRKAMGKNATTTDVLLLHVWQAL